MEADLTCYSNILHIESSKFNNRQYGERLRWVYTKESRKTSVHWFESTCKAFQGKITYSKLAIWQPVI